MWGIWMTWDEYKPCYPGTDTHDPNIGRWIYAGGAFATENRHPVLFSCRWTAFAHAERVRHERRNAHPPFTSIIPKQFGPSAPGELTSCNSPDLSGLSGWLHARSDAHGPERFGP